MKNELLLKQAIELLQKVDPEELEIVQIENTKYDDGSVGFNVSLTYPAEEEKAVYPQLPKGAPVLGSSTTKELLSNKND